MNKPETTTTLFEAIRNSGLGIGLFAILAAGIIAITQANTKQTIENNKAEAAARALFQIYPANIDDNLYQHRVSIDGRALGRTEIETAYQAIKAGGVVGVILPVRSTQGYSGDIDLLVGVNADGTVQAVRVVDHRETPGLGDGIELAKSNWILSFNGKARQGSDDPLWAVKRDGGQFDQFTGATITPRAIVSATAQALDFFVANRDQLLIPASRGAGNILKKGSDS